MEGGVHGDGGQTVRCGLCEYRKGNKDRLAPRVAGEF